MSNIQAAALRAELSATKQQHAAAQAAHAALVAGDEAELLRGDTEYWSHERAKKLAAREIERLRKVVSDLKIAIDDDLARRELEAFEERYAAVKARNTRLRERIVSFRKEVVPQILDLLLDLAQDELDTGAVNRVVAFGRRIQGADAALRSMPAINAATLSSETVSLWTAHGGQQVRDQASVRLDDNGQGYLMSGTSKVWCTKKQFRRVEERRFSPARDAKPLWQSITLPPLSLSDTPIYKGLQVRSPADAIRMLKAAEDEALTTYSVSPSIKVSFEPLDASGNSIVAPAGSAEPPEIRSRTELD